MKNIHFKKIGVLYEKVVLLKLKATENTRFPPPFLWYSSDCVEEENEDCFQFCSERTFFRIERQNLKINFNILNEE